MSNGKKLKVALLLILGLAVFVFLFSPFKSWHDVRKPFMVRVRIVHNAKELKISSNDRCTITDPASGNILKGDIQLTKGSLLKYTKGGINLSGEVFNYKGIRISPFGNGGITVDGTLYRGKIDIIVTDKGLSAVNRIELEEYLRGVLPREVNPLWPMSSLKAQAIASRSFAVTEALRRKNKNFDLASDTFSQVYGGRSAEKWRTSRAVLATKGKVLEYDGKVLPGYFHACCGGHTEDISRLWGDSLRPLRGVKSRWCRWTPYFRWSVRIPTRTILEKLNDVGYYVKRIDIIKAGPRDNSRRLEYVRVKSRNKWFEIPIEDFLTAVGRRTLKSANFRIKKYPLFYLFSGYGWGHGVGMCQWGAFSMGLRWRSDESILEHFYPGAKIVDMEVILKR